MKILHLVISPVTPELCMNGSSPFVQLLSWPPSRVPSILGIDHDRILGARYWVEMLE